MSTFPAFFPYVDDAVPGPLAPEPHVTNHGVDAEKLPHQHFVKDKQPYQY